MKINSTTLRPVLAGALVGLLLTACASERAKAKAKKAKENKDQYVDYYPVGSNIPIKIPKDQAKTSTAETEATENGFRNIQRETQKPNIDESGFNAGIPGAVFVPAVK